MVAMTEVMQVQVSKQNSKCEAGEDNNNSCNNISISRHDGGKVGVLATMIMTEVIRFKYLNKTQNARQERITTIHAITLILKKWISDRLKMLRQT